MAAAILLRIQSQKKDCLFDGFRTCDITKVDSPDTFFDEVRVPMANLVGTEGKGWECTRLLLGNERTLIAKVGFCHERLDHGRELLAKLPLACGARSRIADEISELEAETRALEMIQWRMVALQGSGPRAGALASVLKLKGTDIQQRIAAVPYRLEGAGAMKLSAVGDAPEAPTAGSYYHYVRATTIYGGTSEIQKELLNRDMF